MDIENIQGHPRSFIASYAKDIIVAKINKGEFIEVDDDAIITNWKWYADEIYKWTMQEILAPMTDVQYQFIEDLLIAKKYTDDKVQAVKGNIRQFTIKDASEFIEKLLNDTELPPEYQEKYRQKDIMSATQNRTSREP